jgi:hypothetical protein
MHPDQPCRALADLFDLLVDRGRITVLLYAGSRQRKEGSGTNEEYETPHCQRFSDFHDMDYLG